MSIYITKKLTLKIVKFRYLRHLAPVPPTRNVECTHH